jgi:hypothetical protein
VHDRDDDDDGYDADISTSSIEAGGDFRLAWMFVEGWRQRLQIAGDTIEKHRTEWRMEDLMMAGSNKVKKISSRLSLVTAQNGALRNVSGGKPMLVNGEAVQKKSVNWAL